MKTATLVWLLVAAPYPWSQRQIEHSVYFSKAECNHQVVTERVTDRKLKQQWDWQCVPRILR